MYADTAQKLAQGKVIGWFQGRMEFGPRSLGARSILADPRDPSMRDRINAMVKKREGFRPFAPAVLEEKMRDHFAIDHASPFMLETCQVISPLDLPAITHVDGSARVQSVSAQGNPPLRRADRSLRADHQLPHAAQYLLQREGRADCVRPRRRHAVLHLSQH
jgi:carbamoyltransferase